MFDKPILSHPEAELSHGGVMHEGRVSMVLGLPGMPAAAEDVMTSRDFRFSRGDRRPAAPAECFVQRRALISSAAASSASSDFGRRLRHQFR